MGRVKTRASASRAQVSRTTTRVEVERRLQPLGTRSFSRAGAATAHLCWASQLDHKSDRYVSLAISSTRHTFVLAKPLCLEKTLPLLQLLTGEVS